jgi:hypothetical protein
MTKPETSPEKAFKECLARGQAAQAAVDHATSAADKKSSIPFTQYLLPDGRKQVIAIKATAETGEKAKKLIEQGYRFECEILRDLRTVSLTVVGPNDEGDVACEICARGPRRIPPAVQRLVTRAVAFHNRL